MAKMRVSKLKSVAPEVIESIAHNACNVNKLTASGEMKEILRSRQFNDTLHHVQLHRDNLQITRAQHWIKKRKGK